MNSWPDRRILSLLGIEVPIIQAPMAGASGSEMAIAVAEAGGLGSLPCAMLTAEQVLGEVQKIRQRTSRPLNLNFFCHRPPRADEGRELSWRQRLLPYYEEFGLDPNRAAAGANRAPFDSALCDVVEECKPEVVSFHFGLPEPALMSRVKGSGSIVLSSATSVDEARWLEQQGCDAIIAQGHEAGGHQGQFLSDDPLTCVGTMALVPQVADAVKVPVIAAGGISDGRGIAAAFALGASAVQLGTAYLFCPEATITPTHRRALQSVKDNGTVLTNLFTGRPARGIVNRLIREVGPISALAPAFPAAAGAVAPLRAKSDEMGTGEFSPMWSGQAARLARELPAGELTRHLAADALIRLFGRPAQRE